MERGFAWRMARRELRASGRRLGLFVASVSIGVAAIVAVGGFRANVLDSLRDRGRLLLGADLELESRFAFPPEVDAVLDSVASTDAAVARTTSLPTMVSRVRSEESALLSLGAVDPAYPFYGAAEAEPDGAWQTLSTPGGILADAAALTRLGAGVGDTLAVGDARFVVRGRVTRIAGDPGIRSAVNPRVYISRADLASTGLVREGSLVTYRAYLRTASRRGAYGFLRANRALLGRHGIAWDTAAERERDLRRAFEALSRFLGLVGLGALLLGGVGVAAAMHLYVRQRLGNAAVLRCLGASGWTMVRVYVIQAVALAAAGAALGAALGLGLQAAIPAVLRDVLPLDLRFRVAPGAVATGVLAGLWTAAVFSLSAILPVRRVPALGAVRTAALGASEEGARSRWAERGAAAAVAATVVGLCVWQAGDARTGLAFAAAVGVTLASLAGLASLLARAVRRATSDNAPFAVRQGMANLHRPRNQTRAVVVALGFGVFVIGTIAVVEANVRQRFSLAGLGIEANMAIFDVRPEQAAAVLARLEEEGAPALDVVPIVPARLAAVRGRPTSEILEDLSDRRRGSRAGARPDSARGPLRGWALRREYRNSVRDTMVVGERLVEGAWWEAGGSGGGTEGDAVRVSLETGVARALRIEVGDRLEWDFQGRRKESVVSSIREVDWARLEPNFVAIFEPGALDDVPRTDLILTRVPDAAARGRIRNRIASDLPGALVIDLTGIQQTIGEILDRAALATRFMGAFTLIAGLIILAATVIATRGARRGENALLRALGASSRTLTGILVSEFAALGALAGLAGVTLAGAAGWALSRWVFDMAYSAPIGTLAALWAVTVAVTLSLGALGSRAVVRPSALGAIRAAESGGL